MKRSVSARMTSVYFAYDFSRGFDYAGFFGYAEYDTAAGDVLLHGGRQPLPL